VCVCVCVCVCAYVMYVHTHIMDKMENLLLQKKLKLCISSRFYELVLILKTPCS